MIQVEVIGWVHTKHFEGNVMKLFQKLQDGLAPV